MAHDLPTKFGSTQFASIPFHERQTLAGDGGTFEVDPAVEKFLPEGSKVIEGTPWGASAWTTTSKIRVEGPGSTETSYFMKTAIERGPIMMEGEFNSLTAINKVSPGFAPQVYGWGKFQNSDTYFLIMDFLDLKMVLPEPNKLCQKLGEMHLTSESPTGKFGFPLPTCHGKHIQPNDWDESWCRYFTRLVTIFFETDLEVNGPWAEYENAFEVLKATVIPRLLEPLQSEGRVLKPSLVHGDLWEENTGIDVETGNPVVFDASAFYAHNEYELGMWRQEQMRIGGPHFKQYLRRFPPSEPAKEWDDRNRLYCIKFSLAHSAGWTGSTSTREKILNDMKFLIDKYSALGINQKAFSQNAATQVSTLPAADLGMYLTETDKQRSSGAPPTEQSLDVESSNQLANPASAQPPTSKPSLEFSLQYRVILRSNTPNISPSFVMAPSAELIADVEQRRTDDREKEQTASERGMTESYSTFSTSQKWSVVCFCGLAGSFSTFSAFTYFPAVEDIADDLNVNLSLVYVSVTVYLVTQGVIPAFFGALADQIGRRPVYIVALALYVAACVGLALQRSYVALLALRVLQSAGCSATVALGVIVVSDIVPPHERGKFSGAMLMGPNTGPSIGPVIGGIVAEKLGWWWTFWMLAIFGTICLILFSLLFPETSRAVVGNGSNPAGWVNSPALSLLKPQTTKTKDPQLRAKLHSIPNPFNCVRLILRKEEALIMSNALFYMNYSVLQASLASLLINIYGLNSLEAGLCYLPYGVATLFSSYIVGLLMDRDYCAMAKQADISINRELGDDITKTPIEKARVRSIWLFMGAIFSATLGFGWSIQSRTHLSVPLIMSFVSGFCNNGVFNNCIVIMVDIHPREPGLASVSVSLVRCIAAAIGVSIYPPLLEAVGIGWTFSIFALFLTLTIPMMAVVRVKGPEWRGVTT